MATVLSIEPGGERFTVNGEPTFLYGASYYAGLGAGDGFFSEDLTELGGYQVNWVRVWATWAAWRPGRCW